MDIQDRARAGQNALERLANRIPGFKGYRERELRRDADRLHRDHLATLVEQAKSKLDDAANVATRGGNLDVMNDVETARKRMQNLASRIRWADQGYTGFFDTVKIDEETLGRVYEFDVALGQGIESVRVAANSLAAAGGDLRGALSGLIAQIDTLTAKITEREQILSGVR